MFDHQLLCRRRSRLVLLLAGLLYLVGTVADPIVHAYAASGAPDVVAAVEGAHEDPEEPGSDVRHGEGPCTTCRLAASVALTVAAPAVSSAEVRDDAGSLPIGAPRAPPAHSPSQPRAPPHA